MSAPLTRAELRRLRAQRPLFTARFWADTAERVITSAAGGALAVASASTFVLGAPDSWAAMGVGAGTAALVSLLKAIVASRGGTGSASLVPNV
ncbi:holin [Microbacterium sp. XT11]|uniref:holin n=1 Tax=Microbacterium sp. XT11 TaxID=367477 RepID=UPI00082F83C2|nr:holin [Microbacterium sp. XT11]